jgi:site-specific recombinase XerD
VTPPDPSPALGDAQARFLAAVAAPRTAETYRWALAAFDRFVAETGYAGCAAQDVAGLLLARFDHDVLAAFYRWLNAQYESPHTVRTYLAALRQFVAWCDAGDLLSPEFQLSKAQGRLKQAPGRDKEVPYQHRQIDAEIPRIVTYYDALPLPGGGTDADPLERLLILRARAIIHVLYASGGRVSEVASLTRRMVLDGRIDEVRVRGKGGKTRVLLLTSEALRAIRAYIAERHDDYPALFISHGRGHGQRLGRGTLWKVVKDAALALDLHESTSPHSFRHYRATQLLNEGMPLESVQAYLGHQDISTTRTVYAHTKTDVLRDQLATYGLSPEEALEAEERRRKTRESR